MMEFGREFWPKIQTWELQYQFDKLEFRQETMDAKFQSDQDANSKEIQEPVISQSTLPLSEMIEGQVWKSEGICEEDFS